MKMFSRRKEPAMALIGLQALGPKWRFVNSVYQVLIHTQALVENFFREKKPSSRFSASFHDLLRLFHGPGNGNVPIIPEALRGKPDSVDARTFLYCLLDSLSRRNPFIDSMFAGDYRSFSQCEQCTKVSVEDHHKMLLEVAVPRETRFTSVFLVSSSGVTRTIQVEVARDGSCYDLLCAIKGASHVPGLGFQRLFKTKTGVERIAFDDSRRVKLEAIPESELLAAADWGDDFNEKEVAEVERAVAAMRESGCYSMLERIQGVQPRGNVSLAACLHERFKKKRVEGSWFCKSCRCKRYGALDEMKVVKLPEVLVIGMKNPKGRMVELPLELETGKLLEIGGAESESGSRDCRMELYAVVQGDKSGDGASAIKLAQDSWFEFRDEQLKPLAMKEVSSSSKQEIMLFYKKLQ